MPKFKVYANSIQRFSIEVTAKDENEAYMKAHEIDGGDFIDEDNGDWEIEEKIERIK